MLRFTDIMSSLARLVLVTLLALSIQSCCTRRVIEQERVSENYGQRQMLHDTLYLTQLRYDSIFVERDHSIDRTTDTIRIVERQTEYRFRLVHDTTYIAHTDTLYRDVEKVKEVKVKSIEPRSRTWFDYLAYCSLLLVLAYLFYRIRSPVKTFIRKLF